MTEQTLDSNSKSLEYIKNSGQSDIIPYLSQYYCLFCNHLFFFLISKVFHETIFIDLYNGHTLYNDDWNLWQ